MAERGSPGGQQDGPAEDAAAARARRQQALQHLAAQHLAAQQQQVQQQRASAKQAAMRSRAAAPSRPAGSLRPPRRRTRPINRWLIALGLVPAVIAVAAIVLAHVLTAPQKRAQQGPPAPTAPYITPGADGMVCAADVAWSPQGDEIAVLGYARECRQPFSFGTHSVGIVNIYTVRTRALLGTIHLDDAIVPGIHPFGPDTSVRPGQVLYGGLLWSPDETQLAVSFAVSITQQKGPSFDALGLFVSDLHGNTTTGMVNAPQGDTSAITTPEWSIERTSTTYGGSVVTPALTLPPALEYAWAGSSLGPRGSRLDTGTPVATPPIGPVGNPDGGASFTIWQSGIALLRPPNVAANVGGRFGFYTSYGAWSPDGGYVVAPRQYAYTLIQSSVSTPPSAGQFGGPTPPPYAPMRDKGLAAVYAMLVGEQTDNPSALVAWRPDGAVIAAQKVPTTDLAASINVVLYDCATGKQIATLQPVSIPKDQIQYAPGGTTDFIQWSPDGKHLLVLAPNQGTITIFGPGQLPQ